VQCSSYVRNVCYETRLGKAQSVQQTAGRTTERSVPSRNNSLFRVSRVKTGSRPNGSLGVNQTGRQGGHAHPPSAEAVSPLPSVRDISHTVGGRRLQHDYQRSGEVRAGRHQCHLDHKSYVDWLGIEPGPRL